jgi:putative SOS response-associated peptidase YedK
MRAARYHAVMCGRFALVITGDAVAAAMDATPILPAFVEALAAWQGRYNIAPTSSIPIVTPMGDTAARAAGGTRRELMFARWGLVPFWAKDASIGAKLSNARSETVAVKPAFREAWKTRRCLIPATAFYEWQPPASEMLDGQSGAGGRSGVKRPHAIASVTGEVLAFGGIWERWRDPTAGQELLTVAILTTAANDVMRPIHDRMPVILPPDAWDRWLASAPPESLLVPCESSILRAWPVGTVVNNWRHDRAECLVPVTT